MITLAALDIAGTTVNEQGLVYQALKDAVTERGAEVSDDALVAAMGTRKTTAIASLLRAAGQDPSDVEVAQTYERFTALLGEHYRATPPTPIQGAPEAFEALRARGVKVALTTGFTVKVAQPLLETLGWKIGGPGSMVDALITADTVAEGRPAPYMIFHAMEVTGVMDVREVATAGDTIADVQAGTNAGARLVAGVLTGETPREALAAAPHTHILDSVADLPAAIEQLGE